MTEFEEVWGLVSDVHGNYPALEQALELLAAVGARRLAFLGDYLGRGESDRCVQRIREVADVAVVGNRDLDWQDRVSAATRAWVLGLPRSATVGRLLLAHGDARLTSELSTAQIGQDFQRTWQAMQRAQATVFAFGHSHHARTWRKADLTQPAERVPGGTVELAPGWRYFLNVGTAGLPFPGKGAPSVAVVDFERAQVRHVLLGQDRIPAE